MNLIYWRSNVSQSCCPLQSYLLSCKSATMILAATMAKQKHCKPIFHSDARPLALGPCVGLNPQRNDFVLPIPTCWYLKTLKFALPSTPILKFVLPPMQNPSVSQWNIGCIGSPKQNLRVGHVHFFFFQSIYVVTP